MRPKDVRNLIEFNTRMGMYICPSNRDNVVAFLHGYEYAAGDKCEFTKALSQHLAKKYKMKLDNFGWARQIDGLAEKRSLAWMDIYLLVSSEVLSTALNSK